jgi:hypothetical protein
MIHGVAFPKRLMVHEAGGGLRLFSHNGPLLSPEDGRFPQQKTNKSITIHDKPPVRTVN